MTTKQKRAPARDVITYAFVMSHQPCWSKGLRALLGKGKTLRQCLGVPGVSDADKIWLATRKGACSERVQRLFAAACAERVLPLYEAQFPDDERPRVAIQTATQFALGRATMEELDAAQSAADAAHAACTVDAARATWAAWAAARAAAPSAARAAADAAAWTADAADAAAWTADAAWIAAAWTAAAWTAERAWQVETLRALLEDAQ